MSDTAAVITLRERMIEDVAARKLNRIRQHRVREACDRAV